MARAYSDDLRCKILQAYARGGVTLGELAERFDVSLAYTKKIHQQQLRTGQMTRVRQSRYGPLSRVTAAGRSGVARGGTGAAGRDLGRVAPEALESTADSAQPFPALAGAGADGMAA